MRTVPSGRVDEGMMLAPVGRREMPEFEEGVEVGGGIVGLWVN